MLADQDLNSIDDSPAVQGDATLGATVGVNDAGGDEKLVVSSSAPADETLDVGPSSGPTASGGATDPAAPGTGTILQHVLYLTTTINLVMISYFVWWLWILTVADGGEYMHLEDFENALIMGSFICILLNAAAYPKDEALGKYIKENRFRILRFFIIPFCVSTASTGCGKSPDCRFLLPKDAVNTFLLIFVMIAVTIFGRIIHRICVNMQEEAVAIAKDKMNMSSGPR